MKNLKVATIVLAIGLFVSIVACLLTNITLVPTIPQHQFEYSVTYELQGEIKTYTGIFRCTFDGYSEGGSPSDRYYNQEYFVNGESSWHAHTIAEKDGAELYIVTYLSATYLMNDKSNPGYESYIEAPILEAVDKEGIPFEEGAMPEEFKAEIISWEYPEPIDNTFVFGGFSMMHGTSMLVTLLVGILTIVACMICVRKDKTINYKVLDWLSVALNFAAFFIVLPFITIVTGFMPITVETESLFYQMSLLVPALMAFTIAASIALRRKGFTKSGFFIQFAGPVLFFVPILLEAVMV